MDKNFEKVWKELEYEINWELIHKHMTATKWKWVTSNRNVPLISELKTCVKGLLKGLMESPVAIEANSVGGFVVERDRRNGEVKYSVRFVVDYAFSKPVKE